MVIQLMEGMVFLFLGFKPPKQIYCVHLSAEIMSLDRLSGAAAAVNETLDSHLLCCRPNPAPVQTQMVTWPPQRWRCSFHVTQTLES